MRPSDSLWLVLLSVVLRASSTQQYPRMRKEVEASAQVVGGNGDYYDYVYADEDGFGDLDTKLDAAADQVLVGGNSVSPDCEPLAASSTNLASSVVGGSSTCLPVNNNSQPPATIMEPTDPPTCEPASTLPPGSSSNALSGDTFFKSAPEQMQQMDNFQQQQRNVDASALALADGEQRSKELRTLVQHLYVAQARVQLEATEIRKAQAVASTAQSQLEESANHVRSITATLHNAQQEVAAAAIRAQIAQLQLAAHDQLLFAARQDVDALSSQMVGLQAAEGIVQPRLTVDLHALLDKLRQPLQEFDRPTPVPLIVTQPPAFAAQQQQQQDRERKQEEHQSQGADLSDDSNGQSSSRCCDNSAEGGVVIQQQQPVRYPHQSFNNKHSESDRGNPICDGGGGDAVAEGGGGGEEEGSQFMSMEYT